MEQNGGSVKATHADAGKRLDVFLSEVSGMSRSRVQALISDRLVSVEGKPTRKNHLVAAGERVSWENPPAAVPELLPQDIPLEIVYEDPHLVVVDKPPYMVMYPGHGHLKNTLANALIARFPEMEGVGGRGRPGVVHRLDRDTSGLIAVARTETAYLRMVDMISERHVQRIYIALLTGDLPVSQGTIDAPVGRSDANRKRMAVRQYGGREAVTKFRVTERLKSGYTLVEASLETGRTHQLRVHFAHIGYPVAGDPEYSRGRGRRELGLERQFLHAHRLSFEHPVSGEHLEFQSLLPADLSGVLELLRLEA